MSANTRLGELTGAYVLDPARTRIGFVVRSTRIVTVRGRFEEVEGGLNLNGDDPTRSTARLTVAAASVRTGNRRRDDHLRREFLAVDDHPSITFASTAIGVTDPSAFMITGDLTIRGRSGPVAVAVELARAEREPAGELRVEFVGRAEVNRKDWGVRMLSALDNGSFVIDDRVRLEFEIVAVRRT